MTHSKFTMGRYCRSFAIYHAVIIALALLPAGCNRDEQQAGKAPSSSPPPATQSEQPTTMPAPSLPTAPQAPASVPQSATTPATPPLSAAKPLTDLESLVAPIALYPDPLLAELLVASTYPLEVVQAARWLDTKPDLAGLNTKDWDASVMRLVSVPQVVKMMSDHLDWTTQLGDVFLAKPAELMDAIQALRKRAADSGFLKDTPEQKVTAKTLPATQAATADGDGGGPAVQATQAVAKKQVITIAPAKSETVYVPQYNPETVYQAPLAAPPSSYAIPATTATYAYPAAAQAPSYYPVYNTAPATTTTSTTDSWLTFGAGALVGGLLTWGIMEWADDDDWDDDHHVSHYYGNSVCHDGSCWHGGGGGYYSDRGDINYNKNINISGNDINAGRGGVFNQSNLKPVQQPVGWQPDPRHRRGQAYPEAVQQRLGRTEQPALAGQRLGTAQTLPATTRGFAEAGARPTAGTLPAGRRPSSTEIQQRLAQKPGTQERLGEKVTQPRPSTRDIQGRLEQGTRETALEGLRESGQATGIESRRGAESRRQTPPAARELQARQTAGGERIQSPQVNRPRQTPVESRPWGAERRTELPQQAERRQAFGGRDPMQQMQRRSEFARPNAFDGARDARATQNFSQRGALSRERSAGTVNRPGLGGGARSGGGGGSGGLRGGGGGGRRR